MPQVKKSELKMWAQKHFKGIENVLMPSFSPDLSELDEDGIRWDVRQSIKHGFFSTLCACEAGLTFDEAKKFVTIVADEAGDRMLIGVTLLFDSIRDNMEMIKHAGEAGCSHLLLGFPANFYPRSEDDIYKVAREMADSTGLALVLYPSPHFNFERFHNSGFNPKLLARMAEFDNVIAMKCGEMGLLADCARLFGNKVLVSSPVERMAPLLHRAYGQQWMGAGCYEVFQSPENPYLVNYFNLLLEGREEEAMEIYWMLAPARIFFEQQFGPTAMLGTYNWTLHKFYQWCVGGNGGFTRQPAMKIHQHEMEMTRMGFQMIGIEPNTNDEEFYMGKMNYAKLMNS